MFKKEIAQNEAAIFGNIAFCYGKDKQDKQQIEFCTKVIDRSLYLDDMNVLIKAYLRRGLSYEHCEKFKLAANDLTRVKQMDPMNKQAKDHFLSKLFDKAPLCFPFFKFERFKVLSQFKFKSKYA